MKGFGFEVYGETENALRDEKESLIKRVHWTSVNRRREPRDDPYERSFQLLESYSAHLKKQEACTTRMRSIEANKPPQINLKANTFIHS